jgi:hypothetical protein
MAEQRLPSITTEGEEVKLPGVLVTNQLSSHGGSSVTRLANVCALAPFQNREGCGTPFCG